MIIYDLINYNIDCPELLFHVGLHVPVHFTRTSSLFFVPKCKTNLAAGTFFPRALSLINAVCICVCMYAGFSIGLANVFKIAFRLV